VYSFRDMKLGPVLGDSRPQFCLVLCMCNAISAVANTRISDWNYGVYIDGVIFPDRSQRCQVKAFPFVDTQGIRWGLIW